MQNFEHYTEKLTDLEKTVYVPKFVEALAVRVGEGKAINNSKIREGFQKNLAVKLSEVQVRKIIAYIRDNDKLPGLIATEKGYYVSNDPEEVKRYISSLESREAGFRRARQAMERHLLNISK